MKISAYKSNAWQNEAMAEQYVISTGNKDDYSYFLFEQYLEELKKRVDAGARVLDTGCGTGVVSLALADAGFQVTSVDISKEMLAQLREMDQLRNKSGTGSIEICVGDVFNLPVPDESFDAVISRWVLPHFPEWPLAIIEASHKLKPGGFLFFDMCSSENIEMSKSVGEVDHHVFGHSNNPNNISLFYTTVGNRELSLAASISGLELVTVQPHGFFRQNSIIAAALGAENFKTYRKEFDEHFKNPGANAFIKWFESKVTPHLSQAMVYGMIVVMRRPSSSDMAEIKIPESKRRLKFIAHIKSLFGKG